MNEASTAPAIPPLEWNETGTSFPTDCTVHQLFEEQVRRTPQAIAAVHLGRKWTYQELNARANQLGHALIRRGVGPEVPVGICMRRSLELSAALLGVLKAGGACVPLDPNYPRERLAFMIEDSRMLVLLSQPTLVASLHSNTLTLTESGEELAGESTTLPETACTPSNLAYLIYTSGSTGKPKGVAIEHRSLVNHHMAAIQLYGLTSADRVLQFASISFDIAIEEMFPSWLTGATVIFRPEDLSLEVATFLRWIGDQKISVLDLPTAYWHEIVHELEECGERVPSSLRLVIVGGEKALAPAYQAWRRLTRGSVRWINTYGPTETTVIATAYEPDPERETPPDLPIGRPIANTRVHILNERLEQVAVGEPGELHIGGAGVARGYWRRPEITERAFITDPFSAEHGARLYKSGDLALWLPDGQIEFRGRADDQVKVRGYRVEPGEIERILAGHPGVRHVAVIAKEYDSGDKRLVAYLTASTTKVPSTNELRGSLKDALPDYMIPAAFVILDSIPLTPNGKVDRKALPEPEARNLARKDVIEPKNELEAKLVAIWESVLGYRPIGTRDSFFEIGGNSLLTVRLMNRVERAVGRKLPLNLLFEAPTIEKLSAMIEDEATLQRRWTSLVPIQPMGTKPPFFCVHGVGGTVLRFQWLAQYLGPDQAFYGLQARGVDGGDCLASVEEMAAHYLREIRTVRPRGPYYFGGFSLGGSVAIEMARILASEGERVAFLALFDTFPGRYLSRSELIGKLVRMPLHQRLAYVSQKLAFYLRNLRRRAEMWFLPRAIQRVRKACDMAAQRYQPKVCYTPLTLFRSTVRSLRATEDPLGGWGPWALGGIEVHEIEGDHTNIILEPRVRRLAADLSDCLERARRS